MKSAINLEYICIKPRPQCHFVFASFVLSFFDLSSILSSWFQCFKYSNTAKYFNTACTILFISQNFILQNFFLCLLLNVDSNFIASMSIVNGVLKEKSTGTIETREFYFLCKTAGTSNKNWLSLGTNYTFIAQAACPLIQEFNRTPHFRKIPSFI